MNADFPRQSLEKTPDALVAFTPEGKVLDWNSATELVLRFTQAEAVGNCLST
jgi:PAS domain-containing protein